MTKLWHGINGLGGFGRWAIKTAVFGVVLVLVLFPDVRLLVRQIGRMGQLDAMVDANAPGLAEIQLKLDGVWEEEASPREKLRIVQSFVEALIPYDWDWNTWWVVDYLPTVEEVLVKGREDCDGRAVLAASLLRGRGYDAKLVGNTLHMWVSTEHGETMRPAGRKAVESTPEGVRIHWGALRDTPRHLAFGIAVFPLVRELVVVAALWVLLVRPGLRWRYAVAGGFLMVSAVGIWRVMARDPWAINAWGCWLGLIVAAGGIVLCARANKGLRGDVLA